MRRIPLLVVVLGSLVAVNAAGQEPSVIADAPRRQPGVAAVFAEGPISIDGLLDEADWQAAVPAIDFVQSEPREGQPATERTEVRVLYDRSQIYFGVYCYDSQPARLTVNTLERSFSLSENDVFIVTLDTFDDDRNGFYFATNPSGAKNEAQFFNQGAEVNTYWEGVWHVKTRPRPDGWVAEIAIPFKTLRFVRRDTQVWGINFERGVKRKNEISTWAALPRRYDSTHVALAGRLTGLKDIERGRNLKVKPFGSLEGRQGALTSDRRAVAADGGVDLKYGLTTGLTLDLSVNTDFSHVEVDDQQVNLTRFSLFFPEKRDFFLENSGIFRLGVGSRESGRGDTRESRDLMLFFSRRIGLSDAGRPVPILGGARLTGKIDRYRVGLLNVQTRETSDTPAQNFSVARVRRELLSGSDVGVMFLNRSADAEGNFNRAVGVDANFRFWQNLTLSSFVARTASPGVRDRQWAYAIFGQWQDRVVNANVNYFDIQQNFRNEMGFAPRRGVRHLEPGFGLTLRPPANALIREFYPHTRIRYITDQNNRVLTTYRHVDFTMRFHGGGEFSLARNFSSERLDTPFRIHPDIVLPVGDYTFDEVNAALSSNRGNLLAGNIVYTAGSFWNGRKTSLGLGVELTPNERFGVRAEYSRDDVRLPEGSFTADVLRTRFHYSFDTRMFLNGLIQYNGASEQVITNLRFNVIHRPLSDIFLVYNETRDLAGGGGTDRAITLKYTHMVDF